MDNIGKPATLDSVYEKLEYLCEKVDYLCEAEEKHYKKLKEVKEMVEKLDGLRGFGSNVLANILGDVITQKR